MNEINQKTKISIEVKHMLIILGTIIMAIGSGAGGYYSLTAKVEQNTANVLKLSSQTEKHIQDYQKMNNVVIKNNEKLKNIEQLTKENKSDLKYLIRKADAK